MMKFAKEAAIIGTAINIIFIVWIFATWETPLSLSAMFITMIKSGAFWYGAVLVYIIAIGIWLVIGDFMSGFRRYKENKVLR